MWRIKLTHEESHIQAAIIKELRSRGILVWSTPNDFIKDARSMGTAITMGLLPGASDLTIALPGRVVFMEVKTPTGRLSEAQVKFQEKVEALGHQYAVARSLQEAIDVLSLH
jgi:hypothetical protein